MAKENKRTKLKRPAPAFIFIGGGVMSSVGKGIATASIGKIMQARGFSVTALKIDPYVNVDAGTMNPTEHGEVFVLADGTECDQDMGNYERFLNRDLSRDNYMTTGSIYLSVITKERNMEYGGRCVHVTPDIPLEVISRIEKAAETDKADVVLIEIGGTIGDYQNLIFLEAARIMKFKYGRKCILGLVSHVPALGAGGNELKTKPTQHAIQNLNYAGLHPDFVLARSVVSLDEKRKEKLEFMCSLEKGSVISAPDVKNVYDVPLNFEKDNLGEFICNKLGIAGKKADLKEWKKVVESSKSSIKKIKIAVVGKYFDTGSFVLHDSYISVIEALKHAGFVNKSQIELSWVSSLDVEKNGANAMLSGFAGIVVPGGFGSRGTEGMIQTIEYARENNVPYLGLCYGMQMAVIEYARNVAGLKGANTTEIDSKIKYPVIHIMPDQEKKLLNREYGASMRLGNWDCRLDESSVAGKAYKKAKWDIKKGVVQERHRHRFEFNNEYRDVLEKAGLKISGTSPDGKLVEVIELPGHKFFVGAQFHPELLSRPMRPHPLFINFIEASLK